MLWFSGDATTPPILLKCWKVNVNRQASVCQVAFIALLQKLNGDDLAKIEKVLHLRGARGLT